MELFTKIEEKKYNIKNRKMIYKYMRLGFINFFK